MEVLSQVKFVFSRLRRCDKLSTYFFKDNCTVFHFVALNPCSSSPCLNNGRCTPKVDGFVCTCQSGFSGSICEHGKLNEYTVLCIFCRFYFLPNLLLLCFNLLSVADLGIVLSRNVCLLYSSLKEELGTTSVNTENALS